MPFRQRDVVKINARLPNGQFAVHPFVIITCNTANSRENHYTGVMITSSKHSDMWSMPIDNSMFESPLEKGNCHIRLYIFTSFLEADDAKLMTRMKKIHFTNLINQIREYTLSIDKD